MCYLAHDSENITSIDSYLVVYAPRTNLCWNLWHDCSVICECPCQIMRRRPSWCKFCKPTSWGTTPYANTKPWNNDGPLMVTSVIWCVLAGTLREACWQHSEFVSMSMDTQPRVPAFITHTKLKIHKIYSFMWWNVRVFNSIPWN